VWNTPSYWPHTLVNASDELLVRLTYSNAALLEKLHAHHIEDAEVLDGAACLDGDGDGERGRADATGGRLDTLTLADGQAQLMPYETLISPPIVRSDALLWPWAAVKAELDRLGRLGREYAGRRLYLLYNPVTGRTNGTTPAFFSTMTLRPPGIVDRPHRHVSAAINYFFSGRGWSRVGGRRYEWGAGDLMFTAPSWMVHNHASHDAGPVYELTIQDQPMHIALESLLWQEDLKHPPRLLGVEAGFQISQDSRDLTARP
jgi:hypothetical protein